MLRRSTQVPDGPKRVGDERWVKSRPSDKHSHDVTEESLHSDVYRDREKITSQEPTLLPVTVDDLDVALHEA